MKPEGLPLRFGLMDESCSAPGSFSGEGEGCGGWEAVAWSDSGIDLLSEAKAGGVCSVSEVWWKTGLFNILIISSKV